MLSWRPVSSGAAARRGLDAGPGSIVLTAPLVPASPALPFITHPAARLGNAEPHRTARTPTHGKERKWRNW